MEQAEIWVAIVTLFLTFLGLFWRVAAIYGDLKYQIKQNYEDINRMGNALRQEIRRRDEIILSLVIDIQEHLHETDGYRAPSIRINND